MPSPATKVKNFLWPLAFLKTLQGMNEEATREQFQIKSEAAYRSSAIARKTNTPEAHSNAYKAHMAAMSCAPLDNIKDFGIHAQHAALHFKKWKSNKS